MNVCASMEVSEELMLTWGSHQLTLVNEVAQLRHQGCFADVTLACEGRLYPAHKFILAMCSDYFRNIFGPSGVGGSNSNLVVVLKDVACQDVEHLLDYMYTGVVAVEKSGLHSLIKTAENLQIKGLAFSDTPDPAPSPQRPDPPTYVGGASRHEEVVTEDNSLANSRRINTMGPDVRLNRGGSSASRVPVNARETISPPSKRKKLLDSVGQATGNPSNTSTTFTNNVRTSCSVSQQQMYSSKRRVPSPSGQPSSSSPSDVPAMPLFTEPQSPVLLPASPHQFRQHGGSSALASKCFKDSPERSPGVSEHHPVPSCSVPMVVSSSSQAVSMMVGHNPKDGGHSAEVEVSRDIVDRPENLEIKKEEPDGEAVIGAATEIHLAVEGGPSNETSELKEEPPPEEGESGPSGLHAGLECWGTAVTEGGLLADAADEDEISDTDATGVHLEPKNNSRDARHYRTANSPVRRRRSKDKEPTQHDTDLHSRRRGSDADTSPELSGNDLRPSNHQERRSDPHPQRYQQNNSAVRRGGRATDSQSSSNLGVCDETALLEDDNDIIEIIGSSRVKNSTAGYRTNDPVVNDSTGDLIFHDGAICGFLEGFEPGTFLPSNGEFSTVMPHREEYLLSNESLHPTGAQGNNAPDQMRYTCQYCGRNFDRMSNLKRHLLLHSGSKPFQCLYCEYRAAQKVNVVQHMANRHKEQMTALLCSQVNINDMLTPKE